tara:strand:- start:1611 stop:2624 length:1014 start_codon:yes stop_codon:yes gene_type:complete
VIWSKKQNKTEKEILMRKLTPLIVVASTLASPTFAMDRASDLAEYLESMPQVYGNVQLAHVSDKSDVLGDSNELEDNLSTIGIKHSHMISEGLEGFVKAEFEFNADNKKEGGGIDLLDEAYFGIKGDFGSIQFGSDDTVYEWADMVDTDEVYGLIDSEIAADQEGDNVQYVSPEIADGFIIGATIPTDSDTTFGGALAASYQVDNLHLALAYSMGRKEGNDEDGDTIAIAGKYTIEDLSMIFQYETKDEGASGAKDGKDFLALQGMYNMGKNTFVLGYGLTTYDTANSEDTSTFYVQALHNLSDNMYTYIEYTDSSDVGGAKNVNRDILAIGGAYLF